MCWGAACTPGEAEAAEMQRPGCVYVPGKL